MDGANSKRARVLDRMKRACVLAIIRATESAQVMKAAEALAKGGVECIEVTMNTPGALAHIRNLALQKNAAILYGAGTVTTAAQAEDCIDAGAQFIVTPYSRQEIIETAHKYGVPVLSGAMTPGEIAQAHEWGADVVKVFPAEIFGPAYIKAVRAPLGNIPLMPTGGITVDNASSWLEAGAVMLGVGSALFNPALAREGRYDRIIENAEQLMETVQRSRKP